MLDAPELAETDTEDQLVSKAQTAVSRCNWVVGACAAQWTRKYARGRTDADFAALVGLSADQVYQRRRVWETFGDVYADYPRLRWSHFYVAITWDDAPECLQWADENEATVAEMRAWRRALRGEDLSTDAGEPDAWGGDPSISYISGQPVPVREPGAAAERGGRERAEDAAAPEGGPRRAAEERPYAPFRSDAGQAVARPDGAESTVLEQPRRSAEELLKRAISTLERVSRALTPAVLDDCRELPRDLRQRFQRAVDELSGKSAELG